MANNKVLLGVLSFGFFLCFVLQSFVIKRRQVSRTRTPTRLCHLSTEIVCVRCSFVFSPMLLLLFHFDCFQTFPSAKSWCMAILFHLLKGLSAKEANSQPTCFIKLFIPPIRGHLCTTTCYPINGKRTKNTLTPKSGLRQALRWLSIK